MFIKLTIITRSNYTYVSYINSDHISRIEPANRGSSWGVKTFIHLLNDSGEYPVKETVEEILELIQPMKVNVSF